MSVLIDIYFAVFGEEPEELESKDDALFKDMSEFKSMSGASSPSIPAMRKWFPLKEGSSVPSRLSAIQFLSSYLDSKKNDPSIKGVRAKKFAQAEAFLHTERSKIEERDRKRSSVTKTPRARRENYHHILERLEAFKGAYQLIRPYESDPERYVLEPMTIEAVGNEPSFSLYSHNFVEPKWLYHGQLVISERYSTGVAHRAHERLHARMASRSIILDLELVRETKGYAPRYCFAGLMLRGVTSRKTAIAVPFVAIRVPSAINLKTAKIEPSPKTDTVKQLDRTILVGDFGPGRLFRFCEGLFQRLEFLNLKSLDKEPPGKVQPIISTPGPRRVANSILSDAATTGARAYEKWRSEADEFFSAEEP